MRPVDEILYAWGPGEVRLALIAAGRPVEFVVHREGASAAGGIWLGRVVGVNKALGAAFVDIGRGLPGFLPGEKVVEGQAVLVQARADGHGDKGPKLTANVSLSGPLAAYSPRRPGLSLSRRIADPAERGRLSELAERLTLPDEGLVLRTAAVGRDEEALAAEIASLRAAWREIAGRAKDAKAPACLLAPDPLATALSENPEVKRVLVDDAAAFAALRARYADLVAHHREGPVFALHDADEAFERALDPVAPLRSGGNLMFHAAAAMTVIDVNSGGEAAERVNMSAAAEIARQLRLRGVGGQIVADFIPVRQKGHLPQVAAALRQAAKDDPVPVDVLGVTALGLIEITRERRRASLAETMLTTHVVKTAETLALEALRAALVLSGAGKPALVAAPEVARAAERLTGPLAEVSRRLGRPLAVRAEAGRERDSYELRTE